jgi:hypothetical protein
MNWLNKLAAYIMGLFFIAIGSALMITCEVMERTWLVLQEFYYDAMVPFAFDLMADAYFFASIMAQALFSTLNAMCLMLSAVLLRIAEYSQHKTEQLIKQTWFN